MSILKCTCGFGSICFRVFVGLLAIACFSTDVSGQQQQQQPMEYIESSSPIPGGGVVSSVYVPGESGPVYRRTPGSSPSPATNNQPVRATTDNSAAPNASGSGQSVLDPSLSSTTASQAYPRVASNVPATQRAYQVPAQPQTVNAYQVPAASQIPSLGVPTNWNRAIRTPGCAGCGPGAGVVPYGLGQPGQPSQAFYQGQAMPQPQNYFQQPQQQQQRQTFTPLFQLQSFPVNAYAGQGVLGSPKLYVDGQPIRNIMRYLWIP